MGPRSRSLQKLGEGVRGLHQAGRILRFAAAGEFFRGGLFTDFLATLKTADLFRSCFVRIEVKRFRTESPAALRSGKTDSRYRSVNWSSCEGSR